LVRLSGHRRSVLIPALAVAALAGQLAGVADELLENHVTCLAHGERIHVSGDAQVRPAAPWTEIAPAAVASAEEAHAQCVFDDDVDIVPTPAPAVLPAPGVAAAPVAIAASRRPLLHEPLYRLAPKNSPPA
jgi:hypothetical protein